MRKFTNRDLDRTWSISETFKLSEGELTKLAFLRDYKNLIFFFPIAFGLHFVCGSLGIFGKIVGWIGVILFGLFALGGLKNMAVCFISLFVTNFADKLTLIKRSTWIALQLLISLGNFIIYAFLAFLVYVGMYGTNLGRYIPW